MEPEPMGLGNGRVSWTGILPAPLGQQALEPVPVGRAVPRAPCQGNRLGSLAENPTSGSISPGGSPHEDTLKCGPKTGSRFIGIDAGAETIKLVELFRDQHGLHIGRRQLLEHGKTPGPVLVEALREWDWSSVAGAAVTGRFAAQLKLTRIPTKQAQIQGYRFFFERQPATLVNIGSHGFSVLELRANGLTIFRENSRCSQGTGNFLRQLVERFSLSVEEASQLCAEVANPAPLSGRCPVILKTDMTHLANKGEDRARILAGLFDAVCENVLVLIKPGVSPEQVLLTGGVSRSARVRRVFGEALARQGMKLLAFAEQDSLSLEALGCALVAAGAEAGFQPAVSGTSKPTNANGAAKGLPARSFSAPCARAINGKLSPVERKQPSSLPTLDGLLLPPRKLNLERLPALAGSLANVRRMPAQPWAQINGESRRLLLGFDIGSTGAKVVALDVSTQETVWEGYRQTSGDPVGAAQDLLKHFTESPAAKFPVLAFGATGSGREIVGSLLTSCFCKEAVFIVNEIVAHATGALHFDPRVDTIFEIGGQDAKYIRLAEGRIIDCAMNEACSAGTGSFIEEQGRKFAGISDVRQLGQAAVGAKCGVSLGQHCSVFMAEVIDESVAAGVDQAAIISGLYDSIIKNYLNRVKGNRSVGQVIFCQGMPFSADALAAAVARQTGSEVIVPPNPGTVGALGIALLAARELGVVGQASRLSSLAGLDLSRFLGARVEQKDVFVCRANSGCGGAGNHCRIDRLRTIVNERRSTFTWGGGCSLYDKGARKKKLPDLAPDPFRECDDLLQKLVAPLMQNHGKPRIALTNEFMLKGLFPFFAAFFHEAGYDLEIVASAGQASLKRGIQSANVPFCAPMQLFHGLAELMAETEADRLFVPMLRSVPRSAGQRCSIVCPIVQASPDVLRCTLEGLVGQTSGLPVTGTSGPACGLSGCLGPELPVSGRPEGCPKSANARLPKRAARLLSPRIDFGEGSLHSKEFRASCGRLGKALGLTARQWRNAWAKGLAVQAQFDAGCLELGRRALDFCRAHQVVPVVVLGRSYTIYNKTLNSNVPAILREQGALGIPVDCFPLAADAPQFPDMYWGYGQHILRAAHQVRRTPGVYALYCSNYSCGPDSFNLHFAAYVMEGKPFAIIETDGHSGDAGTKTRVEAFLHCVAEDGRAVHACAPLNDFASVQSSGLRLRSVGRHNGSTEKMLVPCFGPASEAVAAVLRGVGLCAERLPEPDAESLRQGRRFTSGKECLPMPLTLGSLLQRLERAGDDEKFVYVMPSTDGPCRFGVYNLLNQIVFDRHGWRDRLRIWSPKDTGYFDDLPAGTQMLTLAGILASDVLLQALLDVRPVERVRGEAEVLYKQFFGELIERVETAARGNLALGPSLWQVATGRLFGIYPLLERAGAAFARLRGEARLPLVELTGEIYVRTVNFSNDFLIDKLEARGLRVRLAPQSEWLAYCGYIRHQHEDRNRVADRFSDLVQHRIETAALGAIAPQLRWPASPSVPEALAAAQPYVSLALEGEAVLTVGAALAAWRRRQIDAVVNVGPLECMPTKIAEAQFHHLAERDGLLSLTLAFNGEPVSAAALDNFAFEVKARFQKRQQCIVE